MTFEEAKEKAQQGIKVRHQYFAEKEYMTMEALKVIKKMSEGSKECKKFEDAKILDTYLPQMYTEAELEQIIGFYINVEGVHEKKDMGKVMKFLKDTHSGKYDGKLASQIVSKKLV